MKTNRLALAAILVISAGTGAAVAADGSFPATETAQHTTEVGWTFTASPYGWLAGVEGTVGARGRTAHVDASIGDILSDFDIALMGVAEARYDRFGVFTDLMYVQLSTSGDLPLGLLASSADFTTRNLTWTAAAEYRLLDDPEASLDAFAGFRLFSLQNKLAFNPPGLLGGTQVSQTETWADPIVGLKGRVAIDPQFYLTAWGLVGGGASSDVVWDVMAGAGYQFSDTTSAVLGYRAMGVDYENDGFVFDTVQQGPILGAVFRF
jgi:hypothetical protein